ncbi:PaaX family transcriptional regulator C-terminal domain-containing protein [Microbacterium sp. 2FI]|uniref:PaaX family transcriptional regulator n=1 Tax=Microbacterium sp. 2FI TaxID=2502193 RepID=UPI0010F742B8|nr:PaaX family transcriptional regulator C-terminal domain-containing protein [Microbacterium sp. 2FI]
MSGQAGGTGAPLRRVSPARQVLTLFGDYWGDADEPMPSGALVAALGDLGVKEAAARATLTRLTRLELLVSDRVGRRTTHRLSPRAAEIVAEEAAWLDSFGSAEPRWDGLWSVLAFSIPESRRDVRHSARSRLKWLGYAPLYDGVWISPLDTVAEAMAELRELGVADLTSMRASVETSTPDGPRSAWDLDEARREYDAFASELAESRGEAGPLALAERSRLMLGWQRFRGLDAGLPREVLPEGWPRVAVRAEFARRYDDLGPDAEERMRAHVGAIAPELVGAITQRRLSV